MSIPACTRVRGKYLGGFFTVDSDGGVTFTPYKRFAGRLAPDLDQLSEIAQGIEEYGEAFRAYLWCFDAHTTSVADFQEGYLGEYRNREDFAADWLDQTGGLADGLEHPQHYIIFDACGVHGRQGMPN